MTGRWSLNPSWGDAGKKDGEEDTQEPRVVIPSGDLEQDPLTPRAVMEVRAALGLSKLELGDLLGVAERTVKAWEHPNPKASTARNCTGSPRRLMILMVQHPEVIPWLDDIDE